MTAALLAIVVGHQWPTETFTLSVYSRKPFHGRKTASGLRYDHDRLSAASRNHPLMSVIRVTWKGRSLDLTVTDKIAPRFKGVRIDLSGAAWRRLSNGADPGLLKGATVRRIK